MNVDSVWVIYQSRRSRGAVKRVQVAGAIGLVNLLKVAKDLRNAVPGLHFEPGSQIHEFEFALKDSGHFIVENGEKICDAKVPSDRFSAKAHPSIAIIDGTNLLGFYFDRAHSVVEKQPPNECIVKPIVELLRL